MKNEVNEYALKTRDFFMGELDFLNGEIQEFIPTSGEEDTGVISIDIKWKSGVHLIIYQTLWQSCYYAMRNNECISHTFHLRRINKESAVNVQRFINDIDNGRYDKKPTPLKEYLKLIEQKSLTSYMNNTKWNKLFNLIYDIEEKVGKKILIMYKYISDKESPKYYWSLSEDEDLQEKMYRYIEWIKINPIVCEYRYVGRLIEPEYKYYDYTSLILEKLNYSNIRYEYLPLEKVYIVYGYKQV